MASLPDEKANISEKGLLILKPCFYLKSIDPPKHHDFQKIVLCWANARHRRSLKVLLGKVSQESLNRLIQKSAEPKSG
jgi:hypothetical protein